MIAIGEAFEGAIQTMNEYVSEIQTEVEKVFDDLRQLVLDNPWYYLFNVAKSLETTYNEQVLDGVKNAITEWSEGSGSYVSLTEIFRMGDEAKSEAQKQQNQIVDEINNVPEITKISELHIDFTETGISGLVIVKSKLDEISTGAQKLNEIVEEKSSRLNEMSEENESIKTIVNVGIMYGNSIAEFVSQATDRMSNFMSEKIDKIELDIEYAAEDAKHSAEKFNSEDFVESFDDFLNDFFS